MLKKPPILKFFCVQRGLTPQRTTLKFEYLREFELEFENVSGYELGAHMGSIHEKNQGPKIWCYFFFLYIFFQILYIFYNTIFIPAVIQGWARPR
jgi:hypothetical protein